MLQSPNDCGSQCSLLIYPLLSSIYIKKKREPFNCHLSHVLGLALPSVKDKQSKAHADMHNITYTNSTVRNVNICIYIPHGRSPLPYRVTEI